MRPLPLPWERPKPPPVASACGLESRAVRFVRRNGRAPRTANRVDLERAHEAQWTHGRVPRRRYGARSGVHRDYVGRCCMQWDVRAARGHSARRSPPLIPTTGVVPPCGLRRALGPTVVAGFAPPSRWPPGSSDEWEPRSATTTPIAMRRRGESPSAWRGLTVREITPKGAPYSKHRAQWRTRESAGCTHRSGTAAASRPKTSTRHRASATDGARRLRTFDIDAEVAASLPEAVGSWCRRPCRRAPSAARGRARTHT